MMIEIGAMDIDPPSIRPLAFCVDSVGVALPSIFVFCMVPWPLVGEHMLAELTHGIVHGDLRARTQSSLLPRNFS